MRLDYGKLAQASALVAWAAFFHYLYWTDTALKYVGPRTQWVVPFGAAALTVAALLAIRSVRVPRDGPRLSPGVREAASLLFLVLPILFALMVPSPTLGALAVRNKGSADAALAAAARDAPADDVPISVFDIALASRSLDYANRRGITDGTKVDVEGLVSARRQAEVPTIELSRFRSNCCAADAIPYTVSVELGDAAAPDFDIDAWLRVKGTLQRRGNAFVLIASSVDKIKEPSNPYI